MSRWSIPLAYRSLDQPLDADALLELPRALEGEERLLWRDVLHRSAEAGTTSMRPIVLGLEAMTDRDRRRCLDACRKRVGLDSTGDTEAHAKFVAANEALVHRPRRPPPTCAICGCHPTGPGGMPDVVPPARKWHCRDHVHLAAPGDMDAPPLPVDGHFRLVDPGEVERERRADALRAEEDRLRREEREHAAVERPAIERARTEALERELPESFRRP